MDNTLSNGIRIYKPSEALGGIRERVHSGEIGPDEIETILKRNGIYDIPEKKEVPDAQRSETFSHIIGRFNIPEAEYEPELIDAVLGQFDIEYFCAPDNISSLELTEDYRNRQSSYITYLEGQIAALEKNRETDQDSHQYKEETKYLEKLYTRLAEAENKQNKISPDPSKKIASDENGHNLKHVFVLVDRVTQERFIFGQDDLRTLFKNEDNIIERAIVTHLMKRRLQDVNFHKDRLEQLKEVLLINPNKRDGYLSRIAAIQNTDNAAFTGQHFTDSDAIISDFSKVWNAHWQAVPHQKDANWLEIHSLENTLTAIKEITHIKDEEAILGLLGKVTKHTVEEHLQFTRFKDTGSPKDLTSGTVEFLVDSFNKLKQAQSIIGTEARNVKGPQKKDPRFILGTTEGQGALYVADRLSKTVSADQTVLNVSLTGPGPLFNVLRGKACDISGRVTDLDRKKYGTTHPHPNPNLITEDIRDQSLNIEKKFDVVVANTLFHKMSGKKDDVINTILNIRKAMKKGSRLVVTMPPNHLMSKNNLEHLFRIAGFKTIMPPEIKRNNSDSFKSDAPDNDAARNLVDKPFEYSEFELEVESSLNDVEASLRGLSDNFFSTKNPATSKQYGNREIEPEFILRSDYLNALALLTADGAVNKFDATSATPVNRADIIKDHNDTFEENLAALQYFSGKAHGGVDLLTIHEKNILDGTLHAYDEMMSNTLTSTQVHFVLNGPSLREVRVSDLPGNLPGQFTTPTCTLLEAYNAAKKTDGDLSLKIRPRRTLHEKIKYAFDKRLKQYPWTGKVINDDSVAINDAILKVSIPTGSVGKYSFEYATTFESDGSTKAKVTIPSNQTYIYVTSISLISAATETNPAIGKAVFNFIFPSDLIKQNDLISYFKENTTFNERFKALSNNKSLNAHFLHQLSNKKIDENRIDELLLNANPSKEEVEKLANAFGVEPKTLDPDYASRQSIRTVKLKCPLSDKEFTTTANADGNFNKREIVDFVEEALASIEYANSLNYIQGDNFVKFNQVKAKWDEEFKTLDLNDIKALNDLLDQKVVVVIGTSTVSNIRELANDKNKNRIAPGEKPFMEQFRINLPNRIGHAWTKKTQKIDMSRIGDIDYLIDSLKSIGKKEPEYQPSNNRHDPTKAFIIAMFGTLANGTSAFFAPRRLLDPKDVTDHFSSYTSLTERIAALEYNENDSPHGFVNRLNKKLAGNGSADELEYSLRIITGISNNDFTPEVIQEIANLFEVSPTDIDPNYQPVAGTASSPSAPPTPPKPPGAGTSALSPLETQNRKDTELIQKHGNQFRPLDSMAFVDRLALYKTLPQNINQRDLNETIIVELFIAIIEASQGSEDITQLLNDIKKEWNEEFKITLSSSLRERLFATRLNVFFNNCEQAKKDTNTQSYLFSRPLLHKRIETEMRNRLAKIPVTYTFTPGISAVDLHRQIGFGSGYLFNEAVLSPDAVEKRRAGHLICYKTNSGQVWDLSDIISDKHLVKLFTPLISPRERILALATNSNINLANAHESGLPAMIAAHEIYHTPREPRSGEVKTIADFFKVSPTDIDPKFGGKTSTMTFTEALKSTTLNLEKDDAQLLANLRKITSLERITISQVIEVIERFKKGQQANAIGPYLAGQRLCKPGSQANTAATAIQKAIKEYLIDNKKISIK